MAPVLKAFIRPTSMLPVMIFQFKLKKKNFSTKLYASYHIIHGQDDLLNLSPIALIYLACAKLLRFCVRKPPSTPHQFCQEWFLMYVENWIIPDWILSPQKFSPKVPFYSNYLSQYYSRELIYLIIIPTRPNASVWLTESDSDFQSAISLLI